MGVCWTTICWYMFTNRGWVSSYVRLLKGELEWLLKSLYHDGNLKAQWFGGKHVVRKDFENPIFFLLFENPIEEVVYLSFISHIGICLSVKQGSFFVVPFRYAWFSNLSWGIRGLMSLSPYFRGTIGSLDPSNIYMYNIYIYICDIYVIYIPTTSNSCVSLSR